MSEMENFVKNSK